MGVTTTKGMNLKAAIYDPYLDTLGGGERYCLTIAELLSKNGYQVDLFWSGDQDLLRKAETRFNLDLSSVNLVPDIFQDQKQNINITQDSESISRVSKRQPQKPHAKVQDLINRIKVTRQYDLIFYLSDWSIPFLFSKNNLLHVQVPFIQKTNLKTKTLNLIKTIFVKKVICNSDFTYKFATNHFGPKCHTLYPPVDVEKFSPDPNKENIILSVGRFDNLLNSKRQDILIEAFIKFIKQNPNSDWKLYLAGGSLEDPAMNHYLSHLKNISQNLPVVFLINPNFDELKSLYSRAKIYWHAAGHEVNESLHPENTEHFGMAPVEAMASGAVPLLVNKGGLPEIITDGQEGYLWNNIDELISKTQLLSASPNTLKTMSDHALTRSSYFSKENFFTNFSKIIKQ
jgi:glycosyltransferase involved in cell wall biosynthesis